MTTEADGPCGSALSEGLGAVSEARQCPECHGKGWNDAWKKVAGHYMGGEVFREDCKHCEGTGSV
jgi:DnaJ-class molecular chaperone